MQNAIGIYASTNSLISIYISFSAGKNCSAYLGTWHLGDTGQILLFQILNLY